MTEDFDTTSIRETLREISRRGWNNFISWAHDNLVEFLKQIDFISLMSESNNRLLGWTNSWVEGISPIPYTIKKDQKQEVFEKMKLMLKEPFPKIEAPDWFVNIVSQLFFYIFLQVFIPIQYLSFSLDISDQELQKPLRTHSIQSLKWSYVAIAAYDTILLLYLSRLILTALNIIAVVACAIYVVWGLLNGVVTITEAISFSAFFLLLYFSVVVNFFFFITIPTRLISRWWNQRFIESVCVREIVNILHMLKDDRIFQKFEKKKILANMIRALARFTLSLQQRYNTSFSKDQKWTNEHFTKLAAHISEYERWVIAPQDTTLQDLRNEFLKLLRIYVLGLYGQYEWGTCESPDKERLGHTISRLFTWVAKLIGFILPLSILGYYLWNPSIIPSFQFDNGVVTALFVAWIMLSIDWVFNLGVARDLIGLAKGGKDIV